MRRRIYWLLPDRASAVNTLDRLLLARVGEQHVRFVGHPGADLAGLPMAGVMRTSDVVHAAQDGAALGAAAGAIAGLLAAGYFVAAGGPPQWDLVGLLAMIGALLGAWTAASVGLKAPSRLLRCFQPAIADGLILLMVDVPRSRVQAVERGLIAAQGWLTEAAGRRPSPLGASRADSNGYAADPDVALAGRHRGATVRSRSSDVASAASSTIRRLRYGLPS